MVRIIAIVLDIVAFIDAHDTFTEVALALSVVVITITYYRDN